MRFVLLLTVCAATALAAPCPTRASWPTTEWPSTVDQTAATKAAEIKALEDFAFTLTGKDDQRLGLRTDGLVIVKSGTIVYEKYGRGFAANNRHLSWSVAKSITSALTGIAVNLGALKLTDSLCTYLSGRRPEICKITVGDLLQFGSGLHWQEEYENASYQISSVLAMLFGQGHKDFLQFITDQRIDVPPGTRSQYSTGEATLLAGVVQQALQPKLGTDWQWTALFNPIGMNNVVFQPDPKGVPNGGAYVFATPRDFARFGYLYLNDGCWDQQRILPEGWVSKSVITSDVIKSQVAAGSYVGETHGYMWYPNETYDTAGGPATPAWKDAPADAYAAIGHWGQLIIVVPSRDVVIVRTGDDRNGEMDPNQLIPLALAVVP